MKNQSYSPGFRSEAVKLVLEQGLSQEAAAKRLSIPKGTLGILDRRRQTRRCRASTGRALVPALEAENAKLRRELIEVRQERDILKKATAYFAKESLQGTRS